jgi:hypothetical protein
VIFFVAGGPDVMRLDGLSNNGKRAVQRIRDNLLEYEDTGILGFA